MAKKKSYSPKPLFEKRMKKLLKKEYKDYIESLDIPLKTSIRCNTLKISPNKLKQRLENKKWEIKQPFKNYPEILIIESSLKPGQLGRSIEHQLGYYYVQDISSMMPIISLKPKQKEVILDLCAAPGSKTTQAAAKMENKGTIIANDTKLGRTNILNTNLERCGVTNTIVTKRDGIQLCEKILEKIPNLKFDKILVDAPCSGEGTLKTSKKTFLIWNINMIKKLSKIQKKLIASAIKILKPGGELVYSTCTHSPEENEEIIDFAVKNFNIKIEKIELPIKSENGIAGFNNKNYDSQVKLTHRIYPHDNNTEGFFLSKLKKL